MFGYRILTDTYWHLNALRRKQKLSKFILVPRGLITGHIAYMSIRSTSSYHVFEQIHFYLNYLWCVITPLVSSVKFTGLISQYNRITSTQDKLLDLFTRLSVGINRIYVIGMSSGVYYF